ncbi:transglutaminaseTgpA domain-containing protein [Ilumatobacter sp.]|uniref:transglutaminase family protein n=1 Tax=Ilumatobacter sp. TaxID=1967498 RepID=UPI003B52FDB4
MSARDATASRRADLVTDASASVALLVYSVVVATGFARVFSGWDFLDELVAVAIVGHGVSFGLRRARLPVPVAFALTALALAWTVAALAHRPTFSLALPTSATWDAVRLDLDLVGEQFRDAVAPVPFLGGWDLLAAIGVAAAVLLADTFAFRAYARAEALVPGGVLFVFVAALGTERSRIASTMALVAAGVVATVVLRHHHAPRSAAPIGRRSSFPVRALPLALGSALCVALVAGVVGPRLPGASAEPLYETKGDGGTVTEVVSPLVDIRSRLTNRSRTRLFTITADADSYWRSSALAEFDGQIWGIPSRPLTRAGDSIAEATPGSETISQQIVIDALGGKLVPAAPDPIAASGTGELDDTFRYVPDSATLLLTSEDDLETGDEFAITSASPRLTALQLATATSSSPPDPIHLELPDDFPSSVRATTIGVVGEGATPYQAARALQDWMREEFTYDLEVQEGHGTNAIESFLRDRVGYCEQFAGTYAAMLRSVGIASRVAVGFTQGTNDGAGTYSVLGRNAHAWPEVWFDDVGWVAFEPTPGRGAPNAQDYTGVTPQQDDGPLEGGGEGGSAPTTTIAPATDPAAVPPTTLLDQAVPGPLEPVLPPGTSTEPVDGGVSIPWRALLALAALALAVASPALVRRARRRAISAPAEQLAALWDRATGAIGEKGLGPTRALTPVETASATSRVFPIAARPMTSLAEVVTEASYAPDGQERLTRRSKFGTTTLQNCASWCRQVERAVDNSLPPLARIRRYFTVWS